MRKFKAKRPTAAVTTKRTETMICNSGSTLAMLAKAYGASDDDKIVSFTTTLPQPEISKVFQVKLLTINHSTGGFDVECVSRADAVAGGVSFVGV